VSIDLSILSSFQHELQPLFAVRLRYIFWNCIHSKTKRTIFNDNIHEALVQYSAKIISRIAVISLNYRSSVTAFKYSLEIISPFSISLVTPINPFQSRRINNSPICRLCVHILIKRKRCVGTSHGKRMQPGVPVRYTPKQYSAYCFFVVS